MAFWPLGAKSRKQPLLRMPYAQTCDCVWQVGGAEDSFPTAGCRYSLNRSTGVLVSIILIPLRVSWPWRMTFCVCVSRHPAPWIPAWGEGPPTSRAAWKLEVQSLLRVCFESKLWILCPGTSVTFSQNGHCCWKFVYAIVKTLGLKHVAVCTVL